MVVHSTCSCTNHSFAPSDITASQWVGGGSVEQPGAVRVEAVKLFPGANKNISFSFNLDLGSFEWPRDGGNFSGYREVPKDIPVTVFKKTDVGELVIDWDQAVKEGCMDFAVRGIVVPCSASDVLVQFGCVPFDITHMLENYAQCYQEPFFPNTLVQVVKVATKLPPGMKLGSTRLAKRVPLVEVDADGLGLGLLPFFTSTHLLQDGSMPPMVTPELSVIQRALVGFMGQGKLPLAKTAAQYQAALAQALQGEKLPANVLPPVETVWSTLAAQLEVAGEEEGKFFICPRSSWWVSKWSLLS